MPPNLLKKRGGDIEELLLYSQKILDRICLFRLFGPNLPLSSLSILNLTLSASSIVFCHCLITYSFFVPIYFLPSDVNSTHFHFGRVIAQVGRFWAGAPTITHRKPILVIALLLICLSRHEISVMSLCLDKRVETELRALSGNNVSRNCVD